MTRGEVASVSDIGLGLVWLCAEDFISRVTLDLLLACLGDSIHFS